MINFNDLWPVTTPLYFVPQKLSLHYLISGFFWSKMIQDRLWYVQRHRCFPQIQWVSSPDKPNLLWSSSLSSSGFSFDFVSLVFIVLCRKSCQLFFRQVWSFRIVSRRNGQYLKDKMSGTGKSLNNHVHAILFLIICKEKFVSAVLIRVGV